MLIKFRFKNYKSFREEACLDLQSAPLNESEFHIRIWGNEKVLPLSVIYGANASGKSNVVQAFNYMNEYVIDSFTFGETSAEKEKWNRPPLKPYAFGKTNDLSSAQSEFEIWFTDPDDEKKRTYNYGFVLGRQNVEEEWLNVKAKTAKDYRQIFYRDQNSIEFGKSGIPVKSQAMLKETLYPNVLLVSLGAKLKVGVLKAVRDWFIQNRILDFGNFATNLATSAWAEADYATNIEIQKEYIQFISSFDRSIIGLEVDDSDSSNKTVDIKAAHVNEDGTKVLIDLNEESDGTLKMFALFPHMRKVLNSGGVLVIDELNSKLHPLLMRLIMQTFADPEQNPKNAQLIFTSHDVWQLKDNVLRRDEIWFTEKNQKGESDLYSLFDFIDESGKKIRKDEDYLKNYLSGKYGAIPALQKINLLETNKKRSAASKMTVEQEIKRG